VPNLVLSTVGADATKRTVQADWTFNQQLDGVTQSFVRIDWGDGTVDAVASGTTTKQHQYGAGVPANLIREAEVVLLGNDVTVTRRIQIGSASPPIYNPPTDDIIEWGSHTSFDEALEDAKLVLPLPNPQEEGPAGNKGIKKTPFPSPVRNMGR
jgi:hypothetical protein